MAFSMMLTGFIAGKIQLSIGYPAFFMMVMGCCLVTIAVTLLIKPTIDPQYGKK